MISLGVRENFLSEILPVRLHDSSDPSVTVAFDAWSAQVHHTALPPDDSSRVIQRRWDESCCKQKVSTLLSEAVDIDSKARLLACMNESAGSWLNALPVSSLGLKLSDDAVRIAVSLRLGTNICEPHNCICGQRVDTRGTHGLACRRSAGRHPRHSELNDVVWRALQRAQVPATK
jgi:hypothetical protein